MRPSGLLEMKALRISFPLSVLIGMFWRFGFDELSLPVAVWAWLKVVWIYPVTGEIKPGNGSMYVESSFFTPLNSNISLIIGCLSASALNVSSSVG